MTDLGKRAQFRTDEGLAADLDQIKRHLESQGHAGTVTAAVRVAARRMCVQLDAENGGTKPKRKTRTKGE